MEYLVNISKRRAFWSLNKDILKINDSDNQYVVSIKEDTAYPCLHSPKTTKETSSIRRIQRNSIRRIQDIVCEYSGRYQTWSLLQETPIRRIQSLGYAVPMIALGLTINWLLPIVIDRVDLEEYSEEEVAETMAETMEQYMSKTRADYGSGVARPKIEDKDNFELKGQFLKELRTNTFSGSDHEDANANTLRNFLRSSIYFTFQIFHKTAILLRAFPMSLTGSASRWLRNEPTGSITTWDGFKTKILNKYCPLARTAKKMEEINNFQQEPDENLYQVWERFKEILMKHPQHYLTEMQEVNKARVTPSDIHYIPLLPRFGGVTDWYQSQGYREPVVMSSASSAATYTSVYTDSEPGRVLWGADEEISDRRIPRVIVLGYDGLSMQPVAPPSPDYIPGPEDPQTPLVSQMSRMSREAYDVIAEHRIQTQSPEYITESDPEEDPEEYEDDETEDGPVDYPMDGGDDGDDDDSDSSGDDADDKDEDDDDEEEEEEEEH
ncbi:retrovirus-related pol polyprotein from transposon TNT 1-94 [Tanacetum coccineum]